MAQRVGTMAATIDHLRVNHHATVRAPFTDARGAAHQVDEHGILRNMGLDAATMELWIEWEHRGSLERLYFSLRATTGPGNGRMRDYFVLGPDASPVAAAVPACLPPAVSPTASPTMPDVTGDAPGAARGGSAHPAAGTSLGAAPVACRCDPAFHRSVLARGSGVHACLRCGTVTCTHAVGDDGRHTGNAWHAYIADPVSEALLDWLAQWPRVSVRSAPYDGWLRPTGLSRDETIYLPADARCTTPAQLLALEERSRGPVSPRVFPTSQPPCPVPAPWQFFARFAAAVQLTIRGDRASLLRAAEPHQAASALAVSQLLQRDDAFDILVDALQSDDAGAQGAGAALAFAATPVDPRLADVVSGVLSSLPLALQSQTTNRVVGATRCEELLAVIERHAIRTPAVLHALATVQRRVARLDTELARRVGAVLRDLHGAPAAPATP